MIIEITDIQAKSHLFTSDAFKNSVANNEFVVIMLQAGPHGGETCYYISHEEFARVKPLLLGDPTAPALPADVVAAYHHLRAAESGRYTGATQSHIDIEREELINLVGSYCPAEEESAK